MEALLAAAWGHRAPIRDTEVIWGRGHVVRVRLDDGRSAVVKRRRQPPRGDRAGGFGAELAALEYLNAMHAPVAPRLLGADAEAGLMVLEDLGPDVSLAESLLTGDRAGAEAGLARYARALAALHAWSTRRPGELAGLRRRYLGTPGENPRLLHAVAAGQGPFLAVAEELGLPADGAGGEMAGLGDLLSRTGFAALVHGDPCPDNVQLAGGACRLFDFETSSWGAAALDAVFLVAPFPSCWCFASLPADVAGPAAGAYASALAGAGIRLGDDWQAALAAAVACWILARGRGMHRLLSEDHGWGTTTMRPRMLAWLRSFLHLADGAGALPGLRTLFAALLDELSRRWPEAEVPEYPAFARPGSLLARVPGEWQPGP